MVTEIGRDEVQRLVAGGAHLVDARSREDYDGEHIAGALSIPVKGLDRETTGQLDQTRPVITYCWDSQ
jgi:rhodanese-related sulfurtransferase